MKKIIAIALLSLTSGSVLAANPYWTNNLKDEIYVGGNVGNSHLRNFGGSSIGPGVNADNDATSVGVYTGYQFHNNFGAELGYYRLGNFDTSVGDVKADSWNLSLVGRQPVNNRLALTGRVGAAFTHARFQGDGSHHTTPVYGIGAEYKVNKQVALTTNWDRYHNFGDTNHKLDNVSVGLKYTF